MFSGMGCSSLSRMMLRTLGGRAANPLEDVSSDGGGDGESGIA